MLGTVLMWAKPKLFPGKTGGVTPLDAGQVQQQESSYEEISLDKEKRDAIQEAFKVRSSFHTADNRMLSLEL